MIGRLLWRWRLWWWGMRVDHGMLTTPNRLSKRQYERLRCAVREGHIRVPPK